jgi:radical SAM superfamily enzyme YgiQ (UPF0313 family)
MTRRLRVLLVKPHQPAPLVICQPPLGILYLAAAIRSRLGKLVEVSFRDMRLNREDPAETAAELAGKYDLVGISALNCEAAGAHSLARALRALSPETVLALGGPYTMSEPDRVKDSGDFDWIFRGEAERTLPRAVEARFFGGGELSSVPGLIWRGSPQEAFTCNGGEDRVPDLDALPLPAWDLVQFDAYARSHNMNGTLRARRYAPLFTSRGCPYRCTYCHGLFGKRPRWRSQKNVLEEIELLKTRYGVEEFQIVDDIYNLDRRRMREIARKVIASYGPRKLHFTFPNGVRGDILEPEDLPLLRDMGVYDITVAVETASPRLQKLINKNLDLRRVGRIINAAVRAGISVNAFFMLGFPTETREELESTVRFAVAAELTMARFFLVIPQPGTVLWELARKESPLALEKAGSAGLTHYYSERSWYDLAYGVDMARLRRDALLRFYLHPRRLLRVLKRTTLKQLLLGEWQFLRLTSVFGKRGSRTPGTTA